MSLRPPGVTKGNTSDTPVLLRLASRTDLAPRSRSLLDTTFGITRKTLNDTLSNLLVEFDKHLFKLSENSHSDAQQQNFALSSQESRNQRASVIALFLETLEDFFARFDQPVRGDKVASSPSGARDSLSLVAKDDLEETLAVQEFVVRNEVRHSQALFELGHRFAVLKALPALDAQAVPIGPAALGIALRHASALLKIPTEHRILFFRIFDRLASKDMTVLFDSLNACFVEHRILKYLRAPALRAKKNPASASSPDNPTSEAARESSENTDGAARGGAAKATHPTQDVRGEDRSGLHSLADNRDSELFAALRELLAGSRTPGFAASPNSITRPPSGSYVPSTEDVQGVLGALQTKPAPTFQPGSRELRSVSHLKQELLQQLRELSPTHQTPQLSSEDSDTIDLVGMLFDSMASNLNSETGTRRLLPRLQVPLLRVALQDKSFFTRKAHPARQLLNALAETGERWMDGSDTTADQDLLNKLQLLLDRLGTEFDGDLTLIEDMLGDLSEHVQTLTRKAEVAERRQVDAAIGREKLALARETAAQAISMRIDAKKPGPFVRTLLEQAWADVLALTLLRQGEESAAYRKRIEVADRLMDSNAGADKDASATREDLREEIETGLSQIGYHQEDIQAVVSRLLAPESAANDDAPISRTELASKLASKARLGDDKGHTGKPMEAAAKRRATLQLNASEQNTLKQLAELPFGTWFEFTINQQGDKERKKLAWFSKLTGNCMFVNQRGTRTGETTLEELARDVARGQASFVQATQESFVDRAWNSIMGSLKRLGSLAGAFAPPPAESI